MGSRKAPLIFRLDRHDRIRFDKCLTSVSPSLIIVSVKGKVSEMKDIKINPQTAKGIRFTPWNELKDLVLKYKVFYDLKDMEDARELVRRDLQTLRLAHDEGCKCLNCDLRDIRQQ